MIIYYTGTGNSRYVAGNLGKMLGMQVSSIFTCDLFVLSIPETIGLVFPIYSWGVPPHFVEQLKKYLPLCHPQPPKRAWAVCTCGDDIGNARKMLEDTLKEVGIELIGMWSVQMPNTYVLLPGFDVDSDQLAKQKLLAAKPRIEHIADKIAKQEYEYDYVEGSWPHLKTALVYPLYEKWGINPAKFNVSDACTSCGKCVKACQLKNITLVDGRPTWRIDCVGCLACYHICRAGAINYGKVTRNKGHYRLNDCLKDLEKHNKE